MGRRSRDAGITYTYPSARRIVNLLHAGRSERMTWCEGEYAPRHPYLSDTPIGTHAPEVVHRLQVERRIAEL